VYELTFVEIPIGPQHPALHEPILLRLKVNGEEVINSEISTGYNHRGVEKLLEKNTWIKSIYISGRICGICNAVHMQTYVQGIERLLGIEPPPRANYIRTIVMELERIHSHMLLFAVMAETIGFDTLFMIVMKDRERVMYLKDLVTGNRVHADIHIIGGVKRDIDDSKKEVILKELAYIEQRVKDYKKIMHEDYTFQKRLVNVGYVSRNYALKNSLVGPPARASGIPYDIRALEPYAAYNELDFRVVTRKEGDSWSRMMVRLDEISESIEIIRQALSKLPQGSIALKTIPRVVKQGEYISRVEAPRGELIYHIVSKGGNTPYRVKVRTPSFFNVLNTEKLFIGHKLADVPVILVSFDPCISCMERVLLIEDKDKPRYLTLKQLSRWQPK
jgi:Ni,Fe-hydrogenase III large subunit